MNAGKYKKIFEQEGFKHVFEWKDEPGTRYAQHKHKDRVAIYVIDGSITFSIEGDTIELVASDRFDVPVGKEHTAIVGTEGAYIAVGEMVEGDS